MLSLVMLTGQISGNHFIQKNALKKADYRKGCLKNNEIIPVNTLKIKAD